MELRPNWIEKYIQIKSNISNNDTMKKIASDINISRQRIYAYLNDHPEINEIIFDNVKKQMNTLGIDAMKSLKTMLHKNPKALQLALEMSALYTPRSEITNKYDTMDKKDIIKEIHNKFAKIMSSKVMSSKIMNDVNTNDSVHIDC